MRKHLTMAVAAGALLVAMVPGVASAAIDDYLPDGACPGEQTGFTLQQVAIGTLADRNLDGFACLRILVNYGTGAYLYIDNNLPLS